MSINDFSNFLKNFGAEFSKVFKNAFDKPMTKMVSEMKQNYKVLVQNLSGKKADYKDLVKIYNDYIAGDEKALEETPYQKEFAEMKKYFEKNKQIKEYIEANVKNPEDAKKLMQIAGIKDQSEKIAKSADGDMKELEKIFSGTLTNIINGTKDFDETMKSLVNDLQNYFIKTFASAVAKGLMESTVGSLVSNTMEGLSGFITSSTSSSVNGIAGIFGAVASLLGFHSGGYIPRGTGDGFAIPGTAEYLSVLKGGERVLSPAEAIGYNNGEQARKNIVVNNFNVKAWDSKDVQQYLVDNKHLLARLTYENIKDNNGSLRNIIGAV